MRRRIHSPFAAPLGASVQGSPGSISGGLILHWGTQITDGTWYGKGYGTSSVGVRNGTFTAGSIARDNGRFGTALKFTGSTAQFVDVSVPLIVGGTSAIIHSLSATWSLIQWFRVDGGTGAARGLWSETNTSSQIVFATHVNATGKFQVDINVSGSFATLIGSTTIPDGDGRWHCVAVTQSSSGGVKIYLNGVLDGADATMTATRAGGNGSFIGAHRNITTNSSPFNGLISNTSVWNRVLSDWEIASLARNPHLVYTPKTAMAPAKFLAATRSVSLASTIADLVLSSTTGVRANTTLSQTLADLVLSGASGSTANTTLNQTLADLILSGATGVRADTTLNQSLADLALSASFGVKADTSLNASLADLVLSAALGLQSNTTLNLSLADLVLSGALGVRAQTTLDQSIADLILSGSASATPVATVALDAAIQDLLLGGRVLSHPGLLGNFLLDIVFFGQVSAFNKVRHSSGAGHAPIVSAASAHNRPRSFSVPGAGRGSLVIVGKPSCPPQRVVSHLAAGINVPLILDALLHRGSVYNTAFDVLLTCDNGNAVLTHVLAGEYGFPDLTQAEVNEFARQAIEAAGLASELDCSSETCQAITGSGVYGVKAFEQICEGGTWYADFSPVSNRWEFRQA